MGNIQKNVTNMLDILGYFGIDRFPGWSFALGFLSKSKFWSKEVLLEPAKNLES